jgi:predicted membrane protein
MRDIPKNFPGGCLLRPFTRIISPFTDLGFATRMRNPNFVLLFIIHLKLILTMDSRSTNRTLIGLILLAAGIVLLLAVFDVIPFTLPRYWFSWKTILMVLGVIFILTEKNKTTGIILFSIGAIFLARDIFSLHVSFFQLALPVVLLVAGLAFLLPRKRYFKPRGYQFSEEDIAGTIDEVNVFSGGNKVINSDNFRGGEVTCVFGGSEINFKNAKLSPERNVLEVTCVFGGCTLFVPEDWTVRIDTTNVFAGFTDNRLKYNPNLVTDPAKVLHIEGTLLFGGGEIKIA